MAAVALAIAFPAVLAAAWDWSSPRRKIDRITYDRTTAAQIAAMTDRDALKRGFAAQMEPQVDTYKPPYDKASVLGYMTDPRAVRAFLNEPFGEWQFAAGLGLPDAMREDDGATGFRIPHTTEEWSVARTGFDHFVAWGSAPTLDGPGRSNRYRFRRDGLAWTLARIELPTMIR